MENSRIVGKTTLTDYGKNTIITVKMYDLIEEINKLRLNKYDAERVLQNLGVNYDSGE